MHPTGSFHTRENNFDFLRFFAAALVLFAHSYPLVGRRGDEPLTLLTGYEKGGSIAVGIFFVMSGYLITSSWLASSSPKSFLIKRALRIFPALIVAVLLSVFVIGPLVTQFDLARYLAADGTWTYLQNILLVTRYELPGVFTGNVYPDVVNGSLWTLPLEVLMYIGVMILGLTGFLKRRLIFLPIAVLAIGHFWLLGKLGIESYFIKNIFKLGLLYYSGSALFLYRDDIPWRGWIAALLFAALVATFRTDIGPLVYFIALPYLVLYLAYAPLPLISRFGKYGDFSYGLYIYAFPFQQLTIYLFGPQVGVLGLTLIAFVPTLILAALSWHLIEAPAMKLKRLLASPPQPGRATPKVEG
ncbi:acyltransferase family protein [Stutzerimonas kunmingensis]|uniref:acyltransferase family protein n=1 Tax=Stutzerimonas kunmingensis TaxID=1211807 RepID=UPI002106FBC6|nr:acyltransferase [Stutzerimonas kunmingensis]MCQ2033203.1 acyltransferase [Stutzerimonas kunmingensis]